MDYSKKDFIIDMIKGVGQMLIAAIVLAMIYKACQNTTVNIKLDIKDGTKETLSMNQSKEEKPHD